MAAPCLNPPTRVARAVTFIFPQLERTVMRRQAFTVAMRHVEPGQGAKTAPLPTLRLRYDGAGSDLRSALEGANGTHLSETDIDVSLRLKGAFEERPDGVLSVSERLTGDFVCECNVDARDVFEFLSATKRRAATVDGPAKYRIQFVAEGTPIRTYEMDTFLVYTQSGTLQESESLLPNGAQL